MPIRLIFTSTLIVIALPLFWLVRCRAEALRLAYAREAEREATADREEGERQARLAEQALRASARIAVDGGAP